MRKVYRLLGIPIWTVESDEPAPDPIDPDCSLDTPETTISSGQFDLAPNLTPSFGFVDHKDTPEWD